MALITEDISIADKPTLDEVKAMLADSGYGLDALKQMLGNDVYGLDALKTLINNSGGGNPFKSFGAVTSRYSSSDTNGSNGAGGRITGTGIAIIHMHVGYTKSGATSGIYIGGNIDTSPTPSGCSAPVLLHSTFRHENGSPTFGEELWGMIFFQRYLIYSTKPNYVPNDGAIYSNQLYIQYGLF